MSMMQIKKMHSFTYLKAWCKYMLWFNFIYGLKFLKPV